jgi:hypothetical protein
MTGVRSVAVSVALACVVGATAPACTSSASKGGTSPRLIVTYSQGMAPGHAAPQWTSPGLPPPEAAWDGPHLMYITAWRSSGCPELPTSVQVTGSNELTVTTHVDNLSHSDACASDLVPDTSTIRVPRGIDPTRRVAVTIDGTTINLDPVS